MIAKPPGRPATLGSRARAGSICCQLPGSLSLAPSGRRKAWVTLASEPAARTSLPLVAMSLKTPSRYGPSSLPFVLALVPSGLNRPARSVVGAPTSPIEPPGPTIASGNCSAEMRRAGPNVRPPSMERARNE